MQNNYLELKLSWGLFQKAPDTLSAAERSRLLKVAAKQGVIEQHILASDAAANVAVPAATLATRLDEIRQRYASDDEFSQDLKRIGLRVSELEKTLEQDLRIEAVLEKVASQAAPVSAVDAEIYYRLHPEAFNRPESRRLRHILITADHATEKAEARMQLDALRSTLKNVGMFAEAALRHSQCPTALDGGQLGTVRRGQLFAALEPAAFALSEGEISVVMESPVGLHILRCDEIFPDGLLPFAVVQEKISGHLFEQRRRNAQRDWIKACMPK